MPSVIANGSDRWEVRESVSTAAGPRSRTLATFVQLTPDVVERAVARASTGFAPEDLRRAALRAGAPVAAPPADRAAITLLAAVRSGAPPRPGLQRLVRETLRDDLAPPSDAARSAAVWVGIDALQRGEALRDLLLLADALPSPRRAQQSDFPRLASA
jgi:hypothetical protein